MPAPKTFTDEQLLKIHASLFSNKKKMELCGSNYNLVDSRYSKVRYVHVGEYKFLTQNPDKKSFYGFKARAGSQITWIVHPDKRRSWGLIENGIIIRS